MENVNISFTIQPKMLDSSSSLSPSVVKDILPIILQTTLIYFYGTGERRQGLMQDRLVSTTGLYAQISCYSLRQRLTYC